MSDIPTNTDFLVKFNAFVLETYVKGIVEYNKLIAVHQPSYHVIYFTDTTTLKCLYHVKYSFNQLSVNFEDPSRINREIKINELEKLHEEIARANYTILMKRLASEEDDEDSKRKNRS